MQTKKLGEICKLVKGKKPSNFVSKSSKPYLTAKVIRGTKVPEFVSEDCLSSVWVEKDDIVIIMDGSNSGEMFTNLDGALASTMGIVKYQQNLLSPKYLLHFLIIHRENFTKSRTGSAIPHLNKEQFENLEIPLPPLPTQHRIVKILDEVFSDIVQAKEHAEKNLQNAKDLFESYLQGVFANPGEDWEEKRLGDICNFVRGPFGGSLKKNIFKKEGYVVYEQQHAIHNQFTKVRYFIDEKKFSEMKRFELKSSDLIMSCSGTMGKIAIAPDDIKKGIINQALLKLTPSEDLFNVFLKSWMESGVFQDDLKKYTKGAAIKNVVSVKILKDIRMFVPKIQEQKSIVHKLDALSAETKKLEAIYQQKLANLEELKKSVLKKAFAGELVE